MSYHYTYIPRFDPEPAEEEDAEPVNPWLASPPSPPVPAPEPVNAWMGLPPSPHAFNAWVGSPPSPAIIIPLPRSDDPAQQVYYASAPIPEPARHNFWSAQPRAEVPESLKQNFWSAQPKAEVPESLKQNFWSAQPRAEVPESVKQNFWYGQTKSEVDAKKPKPKPKPEPKPKSKPTPVLQQVSTPPTQQFYCREIDGSYTLRSTTEIMTKLQPGFWTHSDIGYPYWVRTKP